MCGSGSGLINRMNNYLLDSLFAYLSRNGEASPRHPALINKPYVMGIHMCVCEKQHLSKRHTETQEACSCCSVTFCEGRTYICVHLILDYKIWAMFVLLPEHLICATKHIPLIILETLCLEYVATILHWLIRYSESNQRY